MLKRTISLLMLCCLGYLPILLSAQNPIEQSVFFPVDGHSLTANQHKEIAAFLQNLPSPTQIEIIGHTDSTASHAYNQALSQKRARAVQDYCISQGISPAILSVTWKGESQPLQSVGDLPHNRRVTLIAHLPHSAPLVSEEPPTPAKDRDLGQLYDQMASDWQVFWVDPNQECNFKTRGGIEFTVPKGALPTDHPAQVKLILKEYLTLGDLLANRISTTSNGKLLQTGGSFQLMAIQGNDTLSIKLRKPFTANIPTPTYLPNMQVFTGNRSGVRNNINWTAAAMGQIIQGLGTRPRGQRAQSIPPLKEPRWIQRLLWTQERELKYRLSIDKKDTLPTNAKAMLQKMREERQAKFRQDDLLAVQEQIYGNNQPNTPDDPQTESLNAIYQITFYSLGYINCDRFLGSGLSLFTLKVGPNNINEDYSLVFPTIQAVMPVYVQGSMLVFPNVPKGLPVRLIKVKTQGDKIYYGELAFKLNNPTIDEEIPLAEYTESTLADNLKGQQF